MKLIPGKCCLTCISDGCICPNCKDWSDYIPIQSEENYQDELLLALIGMVNITWGRSNYHIPTVKKAIDTIEKATSLKWEDIKK